MTGTRVTQTLDAAHIRPLLGIGSHVAGNGLLLRTDIHTLFDLHLITVLPHGTVRTSPSLTASEYDQLDERQIARPTNPAFAPSRRALEEHNQRCDWLT